MKNEIERLDKTISGGAIVLSICLLAVNIALISVSRAIRNINVTICECEYCEWGDRYE